MKEKTQLSAFAWMETGIGIASIIIAFYWLLSILPLTSFSSAIGSALFFHGVVILGVYRLVTGIALVYCAWNCPPTTRRRVVAADALGRAYAIFTVLFTGGASIASVTGALVVFIEIILYLALSLRVKS